MFCLMFTFPNLGPNCQLMAQECLSLPVFLSSKIYKYNASQASRVRGVAFLWMLRHCTLCLVFQDIDLELQLRLEEINPTPDAFWEALTKLPDLKECSIQFIVVEDGQGDLPDLTVIMQPVTLLTTLRWISFLIFPSVLSQP